MCGRYALAVNAADVEEEFSMIRIDWFPPRYNIAPTQPILVIRAEQASRQPVLMRWGLVPAFAKDFNAYGLMFNARAETVAQKPAFRGPLRYRRCLVPASGFYEWRKAGPVKQPFHLKPVGRDLFAMAGLWEEWSDDKGNIIDTATILTTDANRDMAGLHDRMPVVIERADYDVWLGLDPERGEGAAALLRPARAGSFDAIQIRSAIGNARFDDPSLQTPVAGHDAAASERASPAGITPSTADAAPPANQIQPHQLKLL